MRSERRLGILTIGQSPRVDMVPEMLPWLGIDASRVVERGALDGLSPEQIDRLGPADRGFTAEPQDRANALLTTRLADGSSVVLEHHHVLDLLGQAVRWLETEADVGATLVVCSSEFPPIPHLRPLLFAESLLTGGVRGIVPPGDHLGAVCPLPEQAESQQDKWRDITEKVSLTAATPYQAGAEQPVAEAARRLAGRGADAIVLDCMGYTTAMKRAAVAATGLPVLLAREVVARLAGAVMS